MSAQAVQERNYLRIRDTSLEIFKVTTAPAKENPHNAPLFMEF